MYTPSLWVLTAVSYAQRSAFLHVANTHTQTNKQTNKHIHQCTQLYLMCSFYACRQHTHTHTHTKHIHTYLLHECTQLYLMCSFSSCRNTHTHTHTNKHTHASYNSARSCISCVAFLHVANTHKKKTYIHTSSMSARSCILCVAFLLSCILSSAADSPALVRACTPPALLSAWLSTDEGSSCSQKSPWSSATCKCVYVCVSMYV